MSDKDPTATLSALPGGFHPTEFRVPVTGVVGSAEGGIGYPKWGAGGVPWGVSRYSLLVSGTRKGDFGELGPVTGTQNPDLGVGGEFRVLTTLFWVLFTAMGRPPLGPAKRSRTIAIHVTQAQYELIEQHGKPGVWARRAVLDALLAATTPKSAPKPAQSPPPTDELTSPRAPAKAKKPAEPAPTPEPSTPHRHKRERIRDAWIGGQNVGVWKCATCGEPLDWR